MYEDKVPSHESGHGLLKWSLPEMIVESRFGGFVLSPARLMSLTGIMCHKERETNRSWTNGLGSLVLSTAHEASGIRILFGRVQVKEHSFILTRGCVPGHEYMNEITVRVYSQLKLLLLSSFTAPSSLRRLC